MTPTVPYRILVVEDDTDTRANLRDILALDDYEVDEAATAREALGQAGTRPYLAILLDRKLPDGTAEELLPQLQRLAPQAGILIVTGYADLSGAIDALRRGAADYILKPLNPDALRASLGRVAERQQLAAEKERSEMAFRTLVEAAPCLIVIQRPDHAIAYISPFAEELTGYGNADVRGKDYPDLFLLPEDRPAVRAEIQRVLAGGAARPFENRIVCRDGVRRWIVWQRRLFSAYDGGPAVLGVGQDITTAKSAQEKLLQSERLAAIGQMMTGLAHESGNALARSQSCLEMLTWEVEDRPEALELIQGIQKAQDHLQHLYEEVRGYAAPLKLAREEWDVGLVWRQAWESLRLRRQGRTATLLEETQGVDLQCAIDPFRLEQVFRNILENALAVCHDPVAITVRCAETELAGSPVLQVAVRDNGPGLTAEARQRLFEPFFTTKTKGTGLGMAIAMRIVEAHGGQIVASAKPAPGAEILLTLPRTGP